MPDATNIEHENNGRDPIQLHHYTSIRGVEGILRNRAVWASLLHFMNDSREWLYALELVKGNLHQRIAQRQDMNWIAFISELTGSLARIAGMNICAFSLTAMPNQLSQWRAYCPPEGGYNVSFETRVLRQHLVRHNFQLERCIYDVHQQRQIIGAVVDKVLTKTGPLTNEDAIVREQGVALGRLSLELEWIAPLLKHPDFVEEQEWRAFALVMSDDPRMDYHVKGTLVIPHCVLHIETPDCELPVVTVTVGPNNHQALALRGLRSLTDKVGRMMSLQASTSPLRNL